MTERGRPRVFDDPELLELFGDDPAALALIDAVAATQMRDPIRVRRRRIALIGLIATLAASAIALPALGLVGGPIDFWTTKPARGLVIRDFEKLKFAAPTDGAGVVPGATRRVYTFQTRDGPYAVYATPAAHGGFCWGVQALGDTCVARKDPRVEPLYSGFPPLGSREPSLVAGASRQPISRATLVFQDGSIVNLPLVAVSKPIDAVFFLYDVPRTHWRRGRFPARVNVYGPHGQVVGTGRLLYETRR
jgi:hypothetical protein